jgi:TonB-dependent receptor
MGEIGFSASKVLRVTCSAMAICLSLASTVALAQTTEPAPAALPQDAAAADDIVVTGIRASLESAAARKRDSAIVLDSITSEDLGKFPDANVAESLQRVPGVSIDRSNGEGQFITVRGLGPQFNTVLFNGRSLASDNYGREFSFDLLAAELISGADVYKSSQARIQDGGIGATVNLRTARPLDKSGLRGVVTAKANYESNNKQVTPQFFGLISDTFADDTIGILASVSYQKRNAQINSVTSDGWLPDTDVGPEGNRLLTGVYAPRNLDIRSTRDERTRIGATLVGQYRPSDTLLFTVDGLYNKFKSDQTVHALGLWFEPGNYTAATADSNKTVTSLTTNGNADIINNSGIARDTETYEIGLNADWNPTDTLHVVFDTTTSRAKNDAAGRTFFTVAGVATPYSFTAGAPGQLPSASILSPTALSDPSLLRGHLAQLQGNGVAERVYETKFDTEWKADSGALKVIRFGASYTSRNRTNTGAGTLNVGCFYCGYSTPVDPSLFSPFTVGKIGTGGTVPQTFYQYDPNAYLAYLSSSAALAARDANNRDSKGNLAPLAPGTSAAQFAQQSQGNGFAAVINPPDRVRERVFAGYAEVDFEGNLGGFDWFVNIGGRYVHTEVLATSQQRALVDLLPVDNDPTIYNAQYQNNGQFVPITVQNSYDKFLPDVNVRIKLADNINFRLAGSETLTRPTLSDLRPVTSFDVTRPATLQASGGNANLQPYQATNFDASLEWYPTPTTTLSVAAFYKNIRDYVVTTIESEAVTIVNSGKLSTDFINGTTATFQTARPRNAGSANVRGIELNGVTTFDWAPGILSGFGTSLNATFVSTNRPFDNNNPDQRFAVVGLSNSQNATLFYEKYGISARIAYNHRNRFLYSIADGSGAEPKFVRGYGQFDGQLSYDVTPFAQVFVEGTNLFNAKYVTVGRYDNQIRQYLNYGSRFNAGVRLRF